MSRPMVLVDGGAEPAALELIRRLERRDDMELLPSLGQEEQADRDERKKRMEDGSRVHRDNL